MNCTTMAIYLLRCAQEELEAAAADLSLAVALVPGAGWEERGVS
jgi:hypothetical protein